MIGPFFDSPMSAFTVGFVMIVAGAGSVVALGLLWREAIREPPGERE